MGLDRIARFGWTKIGVLSLVESGLVGGLAWLVSEDIWPLVFLGWFCVCMLAYGLIKLKSDQTKEG